MRLSLEKAGHPNWGIAADLCAWSEGTSTSKYTKDDGYDIIVGGISSTPPFPRILTSYARHPNVRVTVNSKGLVSTAAGRYQAIIGTWNEARNRYKWGESFSPEMQDLFFIKKVTERGAAELVKAGKWAEFITKCNKEWASFAGSPYNQNPHTMEAMLAQVERIITKSRQALV